MKYRVRVQDGRTEISLAFDRPLADDEYTTQGVLEKTIYIFWEETDEGASVLAEAKGLYRNTEEPYYELILYHGRDNLARWGGVKEGVKGFCRIRLTREAFSDLEDQVLEIL